MEILRDPWEGSAKCKVTSKDKKQRFIKLTSRARTKHQKMKSSPEMQTKTKNWLLKVGNNMMMDDAQWTLIHLFRVDSPEDSVLPMHWMLKAELKQLSFKRKDAKPQCAAMCLCRRLEEGKLWNFTKATGVSSCQPGFPLSTSTSPSLRLHRSHIGFSHLNILRRFDNQDFRTGSAVSFLTNGSRRAKSGFRGRTGRFFVGRLVFA